MPTTYPIEYRTIPTQYAFLIEKNGDTYTVKMQRTGNEKDTNTFTTEEEARAFINRQEIL